MAVISLVSETGKEKHTMKNMLGVLAGRSFRASRMRNLIAALAIMLTTILFTTVTTRNCYADYADVERQPVRR